MNRQLQENSREYVTMDTLPRLIASLAHRPEYGSDEYKKWVEQDDFVQVLQVVSGLDEILLYASALHVFVYGILVPSHLVSPPDVDDLGQWDCNPFSSWGIGVTGGQQPRVYLAPPLDHTGSSILDRGEQIVFARTFEGRQEQQYYIEVTSRLTHPFDLHYVPERSAYCRFDRHGDVEDIIRVVEVPGGLGEEGGRIVAINRDVLDEYMTMTDQCMVLLFDSTRFDPRNFNGWSNENIQYQKTYPEIWCRMGRNGSSASYLRGFHIVRSRLTVEDLITRHGFNRSQNKQFAVFITQDLKHSVVHDCSCDPEQLGNYFVESDLPFEISPVFFRPEVLLKYKADSEKYQVQDRSITCRNAWHLETYDVNDAGQVFTYLKYLGHLPYDEQLYWRSFNEPPKGPISKRAFQADFLGSWELDYDPLPSLQQILRELHEASVSWWTLRNQSLVQTVHYPVTESADEWAREIHALDKLLIEGFEIRDLRARATRVGRTIEKEWRSLKLLQETLLGLGKDEAEAQEIVEPLRELHSLRNEVSGHASGSEAQQIKATILKMHKSYRQHFSRLCAHCDASLRTLRSIFE